MLDLAGNPDNRRFPIRDSRARKEASEFRHDALAELGPVCK
jgi:hypothetical protein